MGKPVIMGRRTWESLYVRPLPGRRNIVLTRSPCFSAAGTETAADVDETLALVGDVDEAMVIGGADVFRAVLSRGTRLYLTEIHAPFVGDCRFSYVDRSAWRQIARDDHPPDGSSPAYIFVLLERIRSRVEVGGSAP